MSMNGNKDYGQLLFRLETYEDKGLNKNGGTFIIIVFLALCCFVFSFLSKNLSDNVYNQYGDDNMLFYLLIIAILLGISLSIVYVFKSKKMGEEANLFLYEYRIRGTSYKNDSAFNYTFEKFSISYDEICNVSTSDKFVVIYTKWTTYNVIAFNKHQEIIDIINRQRNI